MARKIFVTYKHSDDSVNPINGYSTAWAYVDYLIKLFKGDEIYKGEGNEDLSVFKDDTIATHLKDKIYDSTITIVLVSPNMKDQSKYESDQWIPWEVAYSLKQITRNGRTSQSNAVLAVVLPDRSLSYSYFLVENSCPYCNCTIHRTDTLFQILRENMFNVKSPTFNNCTNHPQTNRVFTGNFSYISSVRWDHFISNKDLYLNNVETIRANIDQYNVSKTVTN